MADFSQAIAVANITDLKALAAVDGQIRKVTQVDASYAYADSYYIFRSGASYTERLPGIVADDAATGFWVMFPQPLVLSAADATGTADVAGTLWVNTSTGNRFIANPDLTWSAIGGAGGGSTTTTTTGYTQPAVDSNVTINVGDSSIFAVGQYVFVTDGGNYKVISKPGATQLEIQNTGDTGNAAPATSIATGKLVTPSGAFGDGTLSGTGTTNYVSVWQTADNIGGDADLTFDSSTDTLNVAASGTYAVGSVAIIDDAAGTTTLKNIDALDTTTRDTIRAAIDDGLTVVYHDTVTLTASPGNLYLLNTTSTAITVTLPTGTNNDVIAFADYNQNFATNNVTINRASTDTIGDATATSRSLTTDGEAIKIAFYNGIWSVVQDTSAGGGGVTNLGYTASPTNGVVTSDTGTDATLTLADGTNAGLMAPADFTKLSGVEAAADVTDTTNVTAAGALMDSEVSSLSGVKTLTVPDNTTISAFGATLTDDADASTARTTLGLGTAATLNVGTSANNVVQLNGSAQLPAVDGSLLTNLPSGFADPMTTRGDIIVRDATNTTARLGIGTSGQVLTSDGTDISWSTPSSGATNLGYTASPTNGTVTSDTGTDATLTLADGTNAGLMTPADFTKLAGIETGADVTDATNVAAAGGLIDPMTTDGDIIYQNASVPARLGVGSEGQVLTVTSGVPAWAAAAGGGGLSLTYHSTSTLSPTNQTVYQLDTGSNAITVTLPSAPVNGTWYGFCDYDGTFGTNAVTINRSGTDTIINGTDTSITLDSNFQNLWLAYHAGNWSVISAESFVDAGGGELIGRVTQTIQTVTYNDGGTSTLDSSSHNVFSLTANGTSTTVAHSNVPNSGIEYSFRLHLTWSAGAITWPSSWTKGMNAPTATGNYIISGVTIDGGTSFTITVTYQ